MQVEATESAFERQLSAGIGDRGRRNCPLLQNCEVIACRPEMELWLACSDFECQGWRSPVRHQYANSADNCGGDSCPVLNRPIFRAMSPKLKRQLQKFQESVEDKALPKIKLPSLYLLYALFQRSCVCGSSRFGDTATLDRKSTRLNSSHSQISYAVFCLKKNIVWPNAA